MTDIPKSLISKTISFNHSGLRTQFAVNPSLFSSSHIDHGTQILINSLRKNTTIDYQSILDLGCGYGALGIFLKKQDPQRQVCMTDRDALATTFAAYNGELNEVEVETFPTLDYHGLINQFSLIVTNFPAKLEKNGLQLFIAGASRHLQPKGSLAMIIVSELQAALDPILAAPQLVVTHTQRNKGYHIYHLQFEAELPLPENPYGRSSVIVPTKPELIISTARSLPEFDRVDHSTAALIQLMTAHPPVATAACFEPNQGAAPCISAKLLGVKKLELYSRDTLALYYSQNNLADLFPNAVVNSQALPWLPQAPITDLVIAHLPRRSDPNWLALNITTLRGRGNCIFYGSQLILERHLGKDTIRKATEISEYQKHLAILL